MAKKKSKGLGDTLEKVTKATGIKKIVEFVAGEDCGCDKRKEKLNQLFSYTSHIECLLEDEYKVLNEWFEKERSTIRPSEQSDLRKIYNRVFNKKSNPTGCSSCVRDMVDRLRTVYTEYDGRN